jgi:hypothetical protein
MLKYRPLDKRLSFWGKEYEVSKLWQTGRMGQNPVPCVQNKTTYVVRGGSSSPRRRLHRSMDFPGEDLS